MAIIRAVTDPTEPRFSLLDAAHALARGADLDAKLTALVSHAAAMAGGLGAMFLIYDADSDSLTSPDGAVSLPAGDAGEAVRMAVRDQRPSWSDVPDRSVAALTGAASRQAVVPLVIEDATGAAAEGVLIVGTDDDGPDPAAQETICALADLAAVAIRQARLHNALAERAEYLERLARTDALTGLADRRTFDQMLELEVARAVRTGDPLAIALFDINGLSSINERHGASAGDHVLREVAAIIAQEVRLIDTVARVGSDEFGVIAPGDAAGVVARRVRDAMAGLEAAGGMPVTVSASVVHHPDDGRTGEELMATALDGLARARASGAGAILGIRDGSGPP
jgi:diguanylate cyclase (GGDEF)-like protein